MKLNTLTACDLRDRLSSGDVSCVDVMTAVLDEIDRKGATHRAFATVRDREELIGEAKAVDGRRARGGEIGPLAGLPVAVKDNISTRGLRTSCGSKILENYVPVYDATVVRKLKKADGILLGKTNLDEFAMGSSTENSAYFATRNPHDGDHVPGGSSGGSAAAVAADQTILAVGSDTGGSIRQPASFCGVVGLKPTYGRVSRYGLVAYASSLDQIGPLGKSVRDVALLLGVLAGHDEQDSTSSPHEVPDYLTEHETRPVSIGVPQEYLGDGLDRDVRDRFNAAMDLLGRNGHDVQEISLPHTKHAVATYYLVACAEASSNLARYDGCGYGHRAERYDGLTDMVEKSRSEGFGAEVKRRIMLGTFVLSSGYYDAFYLQATKVRRLIQLDFDDAFRTCDVIAHPVSPTPPFRLGEKVDDPMSMYLTDVYSVTANLAGLPAISVPCGWSDSGLPVGVQLSATAFSEARLLEVAMELERAVEAEELWARKAL